MVTDDMTTAYPPELYRDREHAELEGERWAHLLSAISGEPVERPFEGRWEIGDRWSGCVLVPSRGGVRDLVGTHGAEMSSPEPEAALFADAAEARTWALEPTHRAIPFESHELLGLLSSATESRRRGGIRGPSRQGRRRLHGHIYRRVLDDGVRVRSE